MHVYILYYYVLSCAQIVATTDAKCIKVDKKLLKAVFSHITSVLGY